MAQTLFPKVSQPWIAVKKEKKSSMLVSLSLSLSRGHRYGRFCRACIVQVVGGRRRQQQPADPIDARSMLLIFLLLPSF